MKFLQILSRARLLSAGLLAAALSLSVSADDTEIFFSDAAGSVNPNVMFVVDVSGSMDETVTGSGGKNRLTVMQNALKTVLKSAPENLNVGLMNYGEIQGRDEGHGVKFPATEIQSLAEPVVSEKLLTNTWGNKEWWNSSTPEPPADMTVRDYLSNITDWYWKDNWYGSRHGAAPREMPHVGTTPIVDALYEAALYFRGEKVSHGLGDVGYWNRWAAHQSTYEGDPIKWDAAKCDNTWTKNTTGKVNFNGSKWPWYRCPANVNNPGASPGTYENCKRTENCKTETKRRCKNWVGGSCSNYLTDEGGNRYCAAGAWTGGYCKNNQYETFMQTQCQYKVCSGGYTSEPNYKTPITQACQSNFIVLLSDGKPQYTRNFDRNGNRDGTNTPSPTYQRLENGQYAAMVDLGDSSKKFDHTSCESNKSPNGYQSGACGPELTRFLSEADNSDLDGKQSIDTYAIGFGLDGEPAAQDYLKSLVSTDDPSTPEVEGYFSAEDEVQLSQAFSNILQKISSTTSSFASPGYSVDLKTGLFNEEDIYIPVFDKTLAPRWNGNLKKFKLTAGAGGTTFIGDKNGQPAVDNVGVFSEDAVDFWSKSSSGDGREVAKGGVAELIDPNTRNAVTDLACNSYPCKLLSDPKNRIHPENDLANKGLIDNEVLGLEDGESATTRVNMLNFIRGRKWNPETGVFDAHPHMGDMLHTEPLIVTYREDYKSNPSNYGQVIYATTNEGYLHAFNTVTGKELFAFMPSSLMKNIPVQYYNSAIGEHAYGIDGIMSKRIIRDDEGQIERVLLYFGLRRGGREYYALDVTKPTDPKLLWKVDALAKVAMQAKKSCKNSDKSDKSNKSKKSDKSNKSTKSECTVDGTFGKGDFARLGQSWSTPYLAKIRTSDTDFREVVIFSGGYDVNQDEEDQDDREILDTVGNEVFIVDAYTGKLLWSAHDGGALGSGVSNANSLTHSIPGGMRIIDMNQDGAIDRMYFADMNAQVWRLELPMGPSYDLSDSTLIKFAQLGGSGAQNRMFFNEPDVAMLKSGGRNWLTVSLGSGYRAHPGNNDIKDRFYVLLDGAVHTPLKKNIEGTSTFKTLKHSDLVRVSVSGDNTISAINQGVMSDKSILSVDGKAGWYMVMPKTGEKILATSITAEGNVMFTSLVPDNGAMSNSGSQSQDLCNAPLTQGRFYSLNILTAEAGSDLNRDGTITDNDLMSVVTANEIPGSPQRVFNKPVCKDQECTQMVDVRVGKRNEALSTYDASLLESVFWTNPKRK